MSTTVARTWMVIARGGRWTPSEVIKELPSEKPKAVESAVEQMADGGFLTPYDGGTYGVTHDCLVPRGVTVAEVLQVTGAK